MELQVKVDEADGPGQEGQRAEFTVDALHRAPLPAHHPGELRPTTTDNVVTYLTTLKVANDDLSLRPGMTATAEIVTLAEGRCAAGANAALRFTPPTARAQASSSIMSSPHAPPARQEKVKVRTRPPVSEPADPSGGGRSAASLSVRTGATNGRFTEIVSGNVTSGMAVITEATSAGK